MNSPKADIERLKKESDEFEKWVTEQKRAREIIKS